jgi:hypothetical protein
LLPTGWNIDTGSWLSVARGVQRGEGRDQDQEIVGVRIGREREGGARTLGAVVVAADGKDADGALVAHALLGDAHDLLVVVGKGDALDGRRELPHEEALARLHGPEPHLVVRRARDEEARLC